MRIYLGILAAALLMIVPAKASDELTTKDSPYSVSDTADRLEAAIGKAGATVFARVDHAANAASVDIELAPTTLVIFGNPNIGTPIMSASQTAGIDLPVRVLIWQADGATRIGYLAPEALGERHGVNDNEAAVEALKKMAGALEKLTDIAISN